jgi:hypothetical protein
MTFTGKIPEQELIVPPASRSRDVREEPDRNYRGPDLPAFDPAALIAHPGPEFPESSKEKPEKPDTLATSTGKNRCYRWIEKFPELTKRIMETDFMGKSPGTGTKNPEVPDFSGPSKRNTDVKDPLAKNPGTIRMALGILTIVPQHFSFRLRNRIISFDRKIDEFRQGRYA